MKQLMRAVLIFIVLSLMTGLAYPLVVTGLAELFFPWKASGSLITDHGRVVGSALIGQKFTKARYFHGRPSANSYDASNSGGTNFGPASAQFIQEVKARVEQTRIEDNLRPDAPIPADLVLASGSGLDPDISVEVGLDPDTEGGERAGRLRGGLEGPGRTRGRRARRMGRAEGQSPQVEYGDRPAAGAEMIPSKCWKDRPPLCTNYPKNGRF